MRCSKQMGQNLHFVPEFKAYINDIIQMSPNINKRYLPQKRRLFNVLKFRNFRENFIFTNRVERHICDVIKRDKGMILTLPRVLGNSGKEAFISGEQKNKVKISRVTGE